jgi:cell division septation protein DedD
MAKEKLIKINVRNLPNGYALTVGTQEYMYYNPMDLLAGFMVHVGLQQTEYMEKGNILTMLFQLLVGEQWEDNVNAMYGKINDMDSRLTFTLNRLEKTAKIGDKLEPRVNAMDETISSLEDNIAKQKEDNRKTLMDVRESVQIVKDAKSEYKKESAAYKENFKLFSSSIKDVRAMREEAEKHLKTIKLLEHRLVGMSGDTGDIEINDDDEGVTPSEKPAKTTKPAKSTKSTKSAKTTKTKKVTKSKKGESNRAKNDLAILAEIERQAKENPNFK